MRKVLRDESSARCPHCIMANERGLGGGGGGGGGGGRHQGKSSEFIYTIFHESLFNLACFLSNNFLGYSCQYFHFISKS